MTVGTEGSEHEILSEFPFDKYQVDLIQVEVHMKKCVLVRKMWSRADPWMYMCSQQAAVEKLTKLMVSNGYTLAHIFVVGVGGSSCSRMHQRWWPIHFSGE